MVQPFPQPLPEPIVQRQPRAAPAGGIASAPGMEEAKRKGSVPVAPARPSGIPGLRLVVEGFSGLLRTLVRHWQSIRPFVLPSMLRLSGLRVGWWWMQHIV